ncbi:MAG: SIS domain-containing protein [Verrucomicrobiaceae bacterium]|nr:SIS domain-containing protein [Verrucomicrobiaceae bacterium]
MNAHTPPELWVQEYVQKHVQALNALNPAAVTRLIALLRTALDEKRQIFVFGNGGSAANASHFVTDLGKGASDALGKRFRVLSLNDNVSWMTAIGNDYAYEDTFSRQLDNFAAQGDIALAISVSGNSPNVVKALRMAAERGLTTIALVGGKGGAASEVATHVIRVEDTHYGRVEDVQMTILHMLCYAFMEKAD